MELECYKLEPSHTTFERLAVIPAVWQKFSTAVMHRIAFVGLALLVLASCSEMPCYLVRLIQEYAHLFPECFGESSNAGRFQLSPNIINSQDILGSCKSTDHIIVFCEFAI